MLTTILLLLGCAALLLFGCFQPGLADRNDQWARVASTGMLIGLGIAYGIATINLWLGLVVAMVVVGLFTSWPLSDVYRGDKGVVAEALVFAGGFLAVASFMSSTLVVALLWILLLPGVVMGVWAAFSAIQGKGAYQRHLIGPVSVVDRDGHAPLAGQGNFNHAQAVGALSVAAGCGLLWMGWPSVALFLPLALLGMVLCGEGRETGHWMSGGVLHLLSLALAMTGLWLSAWSFWWALLLWGLTGTALLLIGKPWAPRMGWADSYRFLTWKVALQEIWWRLSAPADLEKGLRDCQQQGGWLQQQFQQAVAAKASPNLLYELDSMAKTNWIVYQHIRLLKARLEHTPLADGDRALWWQLWLLQWRIRLVGFGTRSWFPMTVWPIYKRLAVVNPQTSFVSGLAFFTAHNEFVQFLFEHGMIGLVLLLAYVGDAGWHAWHGGLAGQAVFLVLATMLSIATINFPWTLFNEIPQPQLAVAITTDGNILVAPQGVEPLEIRQQRRDAAGFMSEQYSGSPALLAMSFVVALLVECVR